jgi:hypothetical protein
MVQRDGIRFFTGAVLKLLVHPITSASAFSELLLYPSRYPNTSHQDSNVSNLYRTCCKLLIDISFPPFQSSAILILSLPYSNTHCSMDDDPFPSILADPAHDLCSKHCLWNHITCIWRLQFLAARLLTRLHETRRLETLEFHIFATIFLCARYVDLAKLLGGTHCFRACGHGLCFGEVFSLLVLSSPFPPPPRPRGERKRYLPRLASILAPRMWYLVLINFKREGGWVGGLLIRTCDP